MKTMIKKIKNMIGGRYLLVYKNQEGEIKTYEISRPKLGDSFGNRGQARANIGFKAYCFGRKQVRSFRHDRIISMTKV